jgi:hypothetical protein
MAQQHTISRNNTAICTLDDGTRCVVLHRTRIVAVRPDGTIELDNGGWETVTTCTRMNQTAAEWGLGFRVGRKGGAMTARINRTGEIVPFNGRTLTLRA